MAQRLMADRITGKQVADVMEYLGVSADETDEVFTLIYAWLVQQGRPFSSADLVLIAKVWSDVADKFLLDEFLALLPSDMSGVLATWRAAR